jgi:hypothetical protein
MKRVEAASIEVSRRADEDHRVACGIPGYERGGAEYADELRTAELKDRAADVLVERDHRQVRGRGATASPPAALRVGCAAA